MSFMILDSSDIGLFITETIITLAILICAILALILYRKYPKLASEGWLTICLSLFILTLHGLFDMLDTFEGDIEIAGDWLNFFDGLFFVLGILGIAIGVLLISRKGAKEWGLE